MRLKKRVKTLSKSRIRIGMLLNVGFALAIGIAAVLGLFSMFSLNAVVSDLSGVAESSIGVNTELVKLKEASSLAAAEASSLKKDMHERLGKGLRTNTADMAILQQTFDELASSLQVLIDSEEEDGTILLLEIEDIHEKVQREWIPLLRGLVSEISKTSADGLAMATTVDALQRNLLSFVDTAEKGTAVTSEIRTLATDSSASAMAASKIMILVLIFSIIGIIIVGYFTKSGIIKPIKHVTERIRDIAEGEGDLTRRIEDSTSDELGELAKWFNEFVAKLQHIISSLAENSRTLATSSEKLSNSASHIAEGSETQNAMVAQVATATSQLNATIVEIVNNVSQAATEANAASGVAEKGGMVVTRTIESMKGISKTAKESNEIISTLGESSKQIGNIINVIDEIADQTNLLALNAAIEAARAGEQGRGFAVVADEVRKLAEKTITATSEIGGMIEEMQSNTDGAILSMENGVAAVEEGVTLAGEAGDSLREIVEKVGSVTGMINQIATAAEQQSTATEQISGDIENVASVVSNTTSNAREIASLGSEIDSLANSLKTTVDKFKIADNGVEEATETRQDRVIRLVQATGGDESVDPEMQKVENL
jgi:methyl-accepting chemotaxis protein